MKKYAILIILAVYVSLTYAQKEERLEGKFIYDKLVNIFHKAPLGYEDPDFNKVSFSYGYLIENAPDGSIIHPRSNQAGDKQFSYTTRTISNNIFTTIESAYATSDGKEFKNTLDYVKGLGYTLAIHQKQNHTDNEVYQMDKLMLTFVHYHGNSKFTYKIIYTINAD